MYQIETKKHHDEIRVALRELQEDVYSEEEVLKNHLWIALKIGTISGIIQTHLQYEDEYLYPFLMEHDDEEVREIAELYMREMSHVKKHFDSFKQKYIADAKAIKNNPGIFIEDTNRIIEEILERIQLEETRLFPLLIDVK